MQPDIAESIYQAALSCGFDNCGIISVDALEGFGSLLLERTKKVPSSKGFYQFLGEQGKTKNRFPCGGFCFSAIRKGY